jgi:hypothetical protein
VCVSRGGPREVRLPRKANVRDLYTGESIGEGIEGFRADFAEDATRVFVME